MCAYVYVCVRASGVMFVPQSSKLLYPFSYSRRDGWLFASNALGEQGFVPGNYVQVRHNGQHSYPAIS